MIFYGFHFLAYYIGAGHIWYIPIKLVKVPSIPAVFPLIFPGKVK